MKYICKGCGKEFNSPGKLGAHCSKCFEYKEFKKQLNSEYNNYNFICNCGKKFKTKGSLNSHARFCELYEAKTKNSQYKISENLYKCECGKEFNSPSSFGAHCSHCKIYHNVTGIENKLRPHEIEGKMAGWNKFSENEINEFHIKSGQTFKDKINNGELIPVWKNKKHTEDSKTKIRISTINYLKENKNFQGPRYSKRACKFIDKLNEQMHWNLQHAQNGGEFEIDGYFVDGYDKDLNIVFEYDEKKHYIDVINNILKEKDIERQNYIISKLNCKFYRYNEKLKYLYEVT